MNYAIFFKLSKPLLDRTDIVDGFIKYQIKKYYIRELKGGFRIMNFVINFYDQNSDCFVKNIVNVKIDCSRYKIPRIIKKLLLEK